MRRGSGPLAVRYGGFSVLRPSLRRRGQGSPQSLGVFDGFLVIQILTNAIRVVGDVVLEIERHRRIRH